jgi:hypothetical protein
MGLMRLMGLMSHGHLGRIRPIGSIWVHRCAYPLRLSPARPWAALTKCRSRRGTAEGRLWLAGRWQSPRGL